MFFEKRTYMRYVFYVFCLMDEPCGGRPARGQTRCYQNVFTVAKNIMFTTGPSTRKNSSDSTLLYPR